MKYLLIILFLPSCVTIYATEPKKDYWRMGGCTSGGEFGTMDNTSLKIKTPSVSITNAGQTIIETPDWLKNCDTTFKN